MKYFVTGATGFVGGALVRRLRRDGHAVVALVRDPTKASELAAMGVELATGDVVEKETMRGPMTGVDGLFHVAGWYKVGVPDKSPARPVNVGGTRNVLELMEELRIPKGVYTSTLAVNSDTRGYIVDETYRFYGKHLSVYDRTKAAAHDLAMGFMRRGLPLVIVQPGMVYGPGDRGPMHDFFQRYLKRRIPLIPQGLAFCWAHIDDVAEGHVLAMEKGQAGETYFLCGPPHTLKEGLTLVERITGVPGPRLMAPPDLLRAMSSVMGFVEALGIRVPEEYSAEYLRVNAGSTYIGTNKKARQELGWSPRSLEEGLPETLQLEMEGPKEKLYARPHEGLDGRSAMSWPTELAGQTLAWKKASGEKRAYALAVGERTVAKLRNDRAAGTRATAETDGRQWKFRRAGFLRPRITIRAEGSKRSESEYRPGWYGGGELVFRDGRRFIWRQRSFWRQVWLFSDEKGQELVKVRCGRTPGKAEVEITPAGSQQAESPLLALLGWYLVLQMAQEAASGSVTAKATTASPSTSSRGR